MGTEARLARLVLAAAVLSSLAQSSTAHAGGLFRSERGSRPGARAGAFVAGADDGYSMIYNPAGFIEAGTSVMLDLSYVRGKLDYSRKATLVARDPNTGAEVQSYDQTFPTAQGKTTFIPIPALAASFAITRDIVVALGAYAPLGSLYEFPDRVKGQPGPQRYSSASLDGSALVVTGLYVAWRPIEQVRIGLGPNVMFGEIKAENVLGTCVPDRFLCAPEQPEFDTRTRVVAGGIFAPSANFGIQIVPAEVVRFGASFDLARTIESEAQIKNRLPSSPLFKDATFVGDRIDVKMKLPWVARAGVEVRPGKATRIELAGTYEAWSQHDVIGATPKGLEIHNIALFPPVYRLGALNIERRFQNTFSVKVGGEQLIPVGSMKIAARVGVGYESSAVPVAYVSPLSFDAAKLIVGLGAGLHVNDHLRVDAGVMAHVTSTVNVSPDEAKLYRVNAVRANPAEDGDTPINGGKYVASAQVYSLGARYAF